MSRSAVRTLCSALMCLVLAACAAFSSLKAPEVSVSDIQFVEASNILEQRFKLVLRVSNPNAQDIAIDGLTFKLNLAGKAFARGASSKRQVLRGLEDSLIEVDATAQLFDLIKGLPQILEGNGPAIYRVYGDVVTVDFGSLPFSRERTLSMPEFKARKPRGESL